MKRAVITGMGIVSCIGNNKSEVTDSLIQGRSGIKRNESYAEIGMRSHVSGSIEIDTKSLIDRKFLRFMGDASAFSFIAMNQAIEDSELNQSQVSNTRTGLVAGSGGGSPEDQLNSTDIVREKGVRKVGA